MVNQKDILLSICIPTYNRIHFLKEALNAIVNQIDSKNNELVEIVISDNASDDGTEEFIEEFIQHNSHRVFINYFRQPCNMGMGINVHNSARLAKGQYIFITSDDDIILPRGIDRLLSLIISNPKYDAFSINYKTFDSEPDESDDRIIHKIKEDIYFEKKDNSLIFLGTFITFMSAICFKKENINIEDYECKIDTLIFQSYIFLDVLSKENGFYVSREAFLGIRANNTGGYNFFEVFVSNFYELMLYAEKIGYSKNATRKVLSSHALFFLTSFIYSFRLSRTKGFKINYKNAAIKISKVYGSSLPLILSAIPALSLIILPEFLIKFLVKIFYYSKSFKNAKKIS